MILGDQEKEIKTGGRNLIGMKFEGLKLKEDPEYQFGDFERSLQFFRLGQNAQHVVSENLTKTLLNITDKIIDSITANFKKLNETENGTNATAKANEDRMASIELQIVEMRKIMQKGPTWPRRDGSFRSDLRTCFQCEEKGHTARDCHQKGQSLSEEEKPTRGMQKSCELQYRTCFQCGERGHIVRNCRQKVQNVNEVEKLAKDLQKSYEMSEQRQKSLDELAKKFDNLDKERQVQDRKLKKLSNENIELLERIDTLNGVLSSSREEIMKFDNLDKEKQVQDRKLEKLSNKNRELLEQIDTLNSDLKSSEEEITNLSSHNQIIESKRQESKVEIVCLKQKCDALEHQLGEAKIDIEKFEIRANEAEREVGKIPELIKRSDNLVKEREEQDRRLEKLSNEIRVLVKQCKCRNF